MDETCSCEWGIPDPNPDPNPEPNPEPKGDETCTGFPNIPRCATFCVSNKLTDTLGQPSARCIHKKDMVCSFGNTYFILFSIWSTFSCQKAGMKIGFFSTFT